MAGRAGSAWQGKKTRAGKMGPGQGNRCAQCEGVFVTAPRVWELQGQRGADAADGLGCIDAQLQREYRRAV